MSSEARPTRLGPAWPWWGKPARWILGVLALGILIALMASNEGLSGENSLGFRYTHTVTRGDLIVTVTEGGILESAVNTEIKCKVRDKDIPMTWVIPAGSRVQPGDELLRLGTLAYEDRINQVSKWFHSASADATRSRADVARSKLAISEYLEGRYRTQLMTLQKDLAIAESDLRTSQNILAHSQTMAERGYVSDLELERQAFAITQAELNVELKLTEIGVLKDFTKDMELETLRGDLEASQARHKANSAQVKQAAVQLALAKGDLENCVVKAQKSGIVIYPTGKPWERVPEIEEGANIYMGQTMLLMPDLSQMQVKVGIREAFIDRMRPGLTARVSLANQTLAGEVTNVASVAGPAGWWNGNTVRYDTIVTLPETPGIMPGMSAEVEVTLAEYRDVLTIPVAAIVETAKGAFCWIRKRQGAEKRSLALGESNDRFTVVASGLHEGDEVVLHPFAIEEARVLAAQPGSTTLSQDANEPAPPKKTKISGSKPDAKAKPSGRKAGKPPAYPTKKKPAKSQSAAK